MNPIDRVLREELTLLTDRLAASVPGGCLEATGAGAFTLRRRLDEAEAQMATLRAGLLEGYARWQRALEDVENLWALAAWRSVAEGSAPGAPAQPASPLAA
jgi:hypothetical protein